MLDLRLTVWLALAAIGVLLAVPARADWTFIRGDVDGSGQPLLNDATLLLDYLFVDGVEPPCLDAADLNDDGRISIVDPLTLLHLLFVPGTPIPSAPYPACGIDPTPDDVDCLGPLASCPEGGTVSLVFAHAQDHLEQSPGIGVRRTDPGAPFVERRLSMRPMRIEASASFTSGTVELTVDGPDVNLFTPAGIAFPLPATIDATDLPLELLVEVTDLDARTLRAERVGTPDADLVTLRPHLFPGLAGRSLPSFPHFECVNTFNEGTIETALDPTRHGDRVGLAYRVHIVPHRTAAEWLADPTLTDVTGQAEESTVFVGSILDNVIVPWTAAIDDAPVLGQRYDVVYDFGLDGQLDPGDLIDGGGEDAGMFVVRDLNATGPYATSSITYSGGTFLTQITYYPTDIDTLGSVPLVVISHGNGHNYTWYEYLQSHLASYGYIVMSHRNNTGPGIETAATSTLENTDYILQSQGFVGGGVLDGHIDSSRIAWIGHSRGGEGVARAYDRIYDGVWTPDDFGLDDIVLVSSIAPTGYLGVTNSNPHEANYHLIAGAADGDVTGCPTAASRLYLRIAQAAEGNTQQTYVWGASHNDFNCCGFADAMGPSLLGRPMTQVVAKSYYLAIIDYYARGNPATREYFTRHYDSLRPSALADPVVVVNQYIDGNFIGNDVIDDYQSESSPTVSSSGEAVTYDVSNLVEGLLRDGDGTLTWLPSDPMNGMTQAWEADDVETGVVFDWTVGENKSYAFDVAPAHADFSDDAHLSFRVCQGTRHPETVALGGPLDFTVVLRDASGNESAISTASYGGVSWPYPRTGCGSGFGWANEFNTLRIPVTDFVTDGVALDLRSIERIEFRFGEAWGSERGRIGLDDVHLDRE